MTFETTFAKVDEYRCAVFFVDMVDMVDQSEETKGYSDGRYTQHVPREICEMAVSRRLPPWSTR